MTEMRLSVKIQQSGYGIGPHGFEMDIFIVLVYDPLLWRHPIFLMGTALVTAPPLLLFTLGAQRLALSTMGFLQYIAPTCMFFLGICLYHEPFTRAQVAIFLLIWMALAIYCLGREITVVGRVAGKEVRTLDEIGYAYPIIDKREIYL